MGKRTSLVMASLAAGAAILANPSPAAADAASVQLTDVCGGVRIEVTGVSEPDVVVTRGDTTVAEFHRFSAGNPHTIGASDGDQVTVRVTGGSTVSHVHHVDAETKCVEPNLSVSAATACDGVEVLTFHNRRVQPLTEIEVWVDERPFTVPRLAPGQTTVRLPGLRRHTMIAVLQRPVPLDDFRVWLLYFTPDTTAAACASASASPTATPTRPAAALPVTGRNSTTLAVTGGALLVGGVLILAIARRRRVRFSVANPSRADS